MLDLKQSINQSINPRSEPADINIAVDGRSANSDLPAKRRRVEVEDTSNDTDSDTAAETEETEADPEDSFSFDGVFTRQAETVACSLLR